MIRRPPSVRVVRPSVDRFGEVGRPALQRSEASFSPSGQHPTHQGVPMITPAVAEEIKQLLRTRGLSQRRIAARTGVSRGTVNAIALGKRPDYRAGDRENDVPPPGGSLKNYALDCRRDPCLSDPRV